jgi:hypothetical protein
MGPNEPRAVGQIGPITGRGAQGARSALATLRRKQIVELRLQGATFEQIAQTIGISAQACWKLFDQAMQAESKSMGLSADRYRAINVKRYEAIILANWGKRAEPPNAAVLLKAMEQQAKLLGLVVDRIDLRADVQQTSVPRAFDTSHLSVDEKRALRDLLSRASLTPAGHAEVEVGGGTTEGGNGVVKANGKSNGNGTHALELPVDAGEDGLPS